MANQVIRFPLILPEPDGGVLKGLDQVLRSRRLLDNLDIALEAGSSALKKRTSLSMWSSM
jgi:hypothetical protein